METERVAHLGLTGRVCPLALEKCSTGAGCRKPSAPDGRDASPSCESRAQPAARPAKAPCCRRPQLQRARLRGWRAGDTYGAKRPGAYFLHSSSFAGREQSAVAAPTPFTRPSARRAPARRAGRRSARNACIRTRPRERRSDRSTTAPEPLPPSTAWGSEHSGGATGTDRHTFDSPRSAQPDPPSTPNHKGWTQCSGASVIVRVSLRVTHQHRYFTSPHALPHTPSSSPGTQCWGPYRWRG
jgi:hypothetical protein